MYRFFRLTVSIICLVLTFSAMYAIKKTATDKKKPSEPVVIIPQSDILAEYQGGMITKKDLDNKISKIPAQAQGRFKTVEGQTQLLDIMCIEDIFYRKAQDMQLLNDPVVLEKIDAAKKQVLIQEYYKSNVTDKVNLIEADKQAYYEENKKDFYIQPYISIKYIQPADEANANKAMAELNKGVSFEKVSTEYNINTYAKNVNGKIKNIRLTGSIPGIGTDTELDSIIAITPVDTINYIGPVKTSTGWSILQVIERIEGRQRPYLECEAEVDQRMRPKKEAELLNSIVDKQKLAYNVVVDSTTLMLVNLREPQKNTDIEMKKVVTASDSSLEMTVKEILDKLTKMSPQEQMMYVKGGGAIQLVNQDLTRTLMYLSASKDKAYDEYLASNEDFNQSKRYYVLQEAYKKLVVEEINVTPEELQSYYDTHLSDYTTPTSRKVMAVWSKDEKSAKKAYKKFAKAVKKNDTKAIADVIAKYSIKPKLDVLDNNYQNGVVTGVGPDQNLSDLIWRTPVGKVSPITKTIKDEVMFFYVVEERPKSTLSYTEVEARIHNQLKKEKEKTQMETVKEQLFTQYGMKKYPEKLDIKLTAEELFDMADNSARQRKFSDAAIYYDQIIKFYPNGSDDYKAFFMKAFLTSEEIGDKEKGLDLFKEFLRKYPQGELNESAQYMIDELEGRHPMIEEIMPEDSDE